MCTRYLERQGIFSVGEMSVPSYSGGHTMGELAANNRRLQDMLHQALRREADALRRLKHLSEQLSAGNHCRTPSPSAVNGVCYHPRLPSTEAEPAWDHISLSQSSDSTPPGNNSQPSTPTRSLLVTSRTSQSNPDFLVSGVTLTPPSSTQHITGLMNGSHHSQQDWERMVWHKMPAFSPTGSRIPSMLAPSPRDLKDVRTERERPPLLTRASSPDRLLTSPVRESEVRFPPPPSPSHDEGALVLSLPAGGSAKKKAQTLGSSWRDSGVQDTPQSSKGVRPRSRTASSMLRPRWLKRAKSLSRSSRQQSNQEAFDEFFSRFVHHSTTVNPDPLSRYIDRHWSEVCEGGKVGKEVTKYRDAVWELFQAECKHLTRQLRPLEQIYKGFLEELHFYGILKIADTDKIFANLSELCELSSSVTSDLFGLFVGRHGDDIAHTSELIQAFSMFGHKFNPVYQRFCVNFEKQRGFVKALEQLHEFQEYTRVCRGHDAVAKNDLNSLLIAPMQHQCHYLLLLDKVVKTTQDPTDKSVLSSAIKAFGVSLKELEGNIVEHKRSLELLELQETISWPPVTTLDTEAYIPECLAAQMSSQPCQDVLASKDRQLLVKGPLRALDARARPSLDLFAFLFTDMLLLTEHKTKSSKRDLTRYTVYKRPLFLHSVEVHSLPFSTTHKHTFTVVEKTCLDQQVAVYSLQTETKREKDKWVHHMQAAQEALWHRHSPFYPTVESTVL